MVKCTIELGTIVAEVPVQERCPWCSGGDLQLIESVYESGHFVVCLNCECCGPVGMTPEDALEKWCYRADRADFLGAEHITNRRKSDKDS